MIKKYSFSALSVFAFFFSFAQEQAIDTVFIFDKQLNSSKKFQKITLLEEDDLLRNTTNLSDVLRFQSPVYIKENGRGSVSSPSFRGTTAQQTAFVWNGININSVLVGQGDVNNMNLLGYDQLQIKSGGGSVIYGSGAIGGTIHLNNELSFNKGFHSTFFLEAGSFSILNTFLKTSFSNDKLSIKVSGNYVKSDNDYEVPEQKYVNLNGSYQNKNYNLGAAYKINPQNTVSWQTQIYDGEQHFPIFSEFATKTKYLTQTFRSLLEWNFKSSQFSNTFKVAFLQDDFQYFDHLEGPKNSGGNSHVYLAKNDFNYLFNDKIAINLIADYQTTTAEGFNSGIQTPKRNSGSLAGLLRWNPSHKFNFEAGIKQDFVEKIESPFLFSFSGKLNASPFYNVALNISKNFRYPSFNDLYWKPGGNLDLRSEISHQAELVNKFTFGNFTFNATPYFISINDMIRWLPNNKGIWAPINTNKVESYGLESELNFAKDFGQNKTKLSVGYGFAHSENVETKKLLSYVPQHKLFGTAVYQYQIFELFLQGTYNGLTYTTDDENLQYSIDPYFVINTGVKVILLKNYQIGFKVNNVFDEVYETTKDYFLPIRNYSANLLINF
ncbi:TonB-dependent receptor plug domain-containing protein [Kaistella polysaccharea]|uniref:TonB-dependent receptor plug domain-containing protein n=1 Tax=Kaistella polysaccharea TaxID=2878534 RepID=UPI001CF11297|nr:TonB-dependent receptor [Kaistella polysaccharea]